jgi:hypothetical protein
MLRLWGKSRSNNKARRNMSKGQQAMALIYPGPGKGGRGNKGESRNLAEAAKLAIGA